jgi:hypothetical protein
MSRLISQRQRLGPDDALLGPLGCRLDVAGFNLGEGGLHHDDTSTRFWSLPFSAHAAGRFRGIRAAGTGARRRSTADSAIA